MFVFSILPHFELLCPFKMLFSMLRFDSLNLPSTRIPSDKNEWPQNARVRTWFGQNVLWCEYNENEESGRHLPAHKLDHYRQIGDPALDSLLERLEQEGHPLRAGDDFLGLVSSENNALSPQLRQDLKAFLEYHRKIPGWVDPNQLQRGQDVFLKYSAAMGISLYYRSLVAGFSIPKIAAVITRTGYLVGSPDRVKTRLLDTGALMAACMTGSVDSLRPDAQGWKAALQVRVLHAKCRRALLKRKWDGDTLGIPINQEDMAATLLAFGINTIWGVEIVAGRALSRQEQIDYIALWRYIGWLLGVHTVNEQPEYNDPSLAVSRPLDPCGPGWHATDKDSIGHSKSMLESIIFHLLTPDKTSVSVSHHLLRIGRPNAKEKAGMSKAELKKEDEQDEYWFYLRALNCRRFIGDPLADALQLPLHENRWMRIRLWLKSTYLLGLIRAWTLGAMLCSPLRKWMYQKHLNAMSRYFETWQESHPKRVGEELSKQDATNKVSSEKAHDESKARPACPFAMVAPPQ